MFGYALKHPAKSANQVSDVLNDILSFKAKF